MEDWDDFLKGRYQEGKSEAEFRQYDATATPGVAEFYRLNHENQTVDYVLGKEKEYFGLNKGKKTVWEAAEFLNTLVDESDPDTDLTQIEHLLQTSEAIRRDGHPGAGCGPDRLSFTTWVKCLCSAQWRASPNGALSATRSPSAARGRRGHRVSLSTSPTIRTGTSPGIRRSTASTSRIVVSRTST